MKAIILAGGMGTRLRGVIGDVPKPMAPVGGKPFLEYLIHQLKRWGILEIILSVGFRKDIIKSHFRDGSPLGVLINYSDENEPLGTGGALKKAISSISDSCFIVMNGDSYFNVDFRDLISFHTDNADLITMGLVRVKSMNRYGNVEIGKDGIVLSFQKKGPDAPGLINGGIYVVRRDIADHIPEGKISLEERVMPELIKEKRLYGKVFDAFFLDMGIPEDYFWLDKHPESLS